LGAGVLSKIVAEEVALRRVIVDTLVITPSGALSPGMLSAAAVVVGLYLGAVGGLLVALGHMVFELPYVAALVYWAEKLEARLRRYEKPLALVTLGVAIYFAAGLIASAITIFQRGSVPINDSLSLGSSPLGAIAAGIVFTGGNPYFLAWWITIGLPLIRGAARNGAAGFAAMYTAHVWIDYVWLAILAGLGGLLSKIATIYAWLLVGLAALLLYFAATMTIQVLRGKRNNT